jgi:hypothetical protein
MTANLNVNIQVQIPDGLDESTVDMIQGMLFNAKISTNVTLTETEDEVYLSRKDGKFEIHSKVLDEEK